ncbi:MAG: bifunctional acetate--CoA ligase family protein/GNAT family N-acetyltransferase [Parachlamydiales bacterium]|nr:bifunctional acetate--CoA ligase family protein/GNAT family N-acetyltransferase [Parachlamydiales bacterium]
MKDYKFDPSLNILYKQHHKLDYIFSPENVALIGASEKEGSVGKTILSNLLSSDFGGKVFPVNPKRESVLGVKAYPSVKDIKEKIDLAVIATPSHTVPKVIEQCVNANIPTAIIISAGFKELGEKGKELENEVLNLAKKGKMRIVGPNCLGVMNPIKGLNATFASGMALKGNIAFLSQSGALCTAVLDWSFKERVGFSAFVSIGSMVDVDWGDLIAYFGNDPNTKSILIYMESINDPRAFLSAAREVALSKPIILIKAGRSAESAKAAASHTGALTGSDDVLNAALKRVGILRVETISDLFSMTEVLSKQPRPKGPNLAIITNAGGPGVIATDALIQEGAKLAKLNDKTIQELNSFLPDAWSHNNPIDILGDATVDLYEKTLSIVAKDPNVDGVLVILTPQYMTDPTAVAEKIKKFSKIDQKPIFASWMGAKSVEDGSKILSDFQIPTFEYPDTACRTFAYMYKYSYNIKGIYETPLLEVKIDNEKVICKRHKIIFDIFKKVRDEKRTLLDEYESKKVLEVYDIPTVITKIAKTSKEAAKIAEEMGYPIVLKLFSKTITHKSDVGGVKLNLNTAKDIEKAFLEIKESVSKISNPKDFEGVTVQKMIKQKGYELILGSSCDPQFGPVLLFGTGGQLVEIYKDKTLGLPPLTSTLSRRMIERTKIFDALKGVRGQKAIDFNELEKILISFSYLIAEYPEIKEFDINPLLASSDGIIALDARIILHDKNESYPELAIRPYPLKYVKDWKLKNDASVIIRPISPEDEPLIISFYKDVSEKSLKQRYFKVLHYPELIAHERLVKICFNDFDREIVLVIEHKQSNNSSEILGLARLTKLEGTNDATFSILVKDKWQNQGIGKKLLTSLIKIAKDEKIEYLLSQMFKDNIGMKKMCKDLGFSLEESKEYPVIFAELYLDGIGK